MRDDLLRAYEAHQRETAETDGVIAGRAGIARENLCRVLRKLRTGEGDVESETLRRVAGAIGMRWTLAPVQPAETPSHHGQHHTEAAQSALTYLRGPFDPPLSDRERQALDVLEQEIKNLEAAFQQATDRVDALTLDTAELVAEVGRLRKGAAS